MLALKGKHAMVVQQNLGWKESSEAKVEALDKGMHGKFKKVSSSYCK